MPVDTGLKLPVLGKLPSGWQIVELRAVLENGARNGIYKPPQFHGTGAKMVNMGELFAHPRLKSVPMQRVELTQDEEERFGLRVGDLLFARRSLVAEGAGKCSVVLEVGGPTAFESSLIRARPNPTVADSLFLYYLFTSKFGSYALGTILRQVAVSGITGSDLVRLKIPLPPLPEQKVIVRVLSALDDKIELNRGMNETLEAMARAIFKSWFVDFDPVRAKLALSKAEGAEGRLPCGMDAETAALFPDSFQDSPLGKIPEGWRVSAVGEDFNLTMGQSPPGETYNEDGVGLAFFQGKTDFGFRYPSKRMYCSAPTRLADMGDTMVSVRAPVGAINMANEKCCIGRGVAALRHKNGSRSYTYYAVHAQKEAFEQFEAEGTVFGSIGRKDFEGILCVSPPVGLIEKFEQMAFPFDQTVENNEHESRTLTAIRDALLPKLISGEICVMSAEGTLGSTL